MSIDALVELLPRHLVMVKSSLFMEVLKNYWVDEAFSNTPLLLVSMSQMQPIEQTMPAGGDNLVVLPHL